MSSFEGGTFGEIPSPIEGQEETPVLMQQPEEQSEQQPELPGNAAQPLPAT